MSFKYRSMREAVDKEWSKEVPDENHKEQSQ